MCGVFADAPVSLERRAVGDRLIDRRIRRGRGLAYVGRLLFRGPARLPRGVSSRDSVFCAHRARAMWRPCTPPQRLLALLRGCLRRRAIGGDRSL